MYYFFDYILNNMDDKSEYYHEQLIKSMIFSYTIKKVELQLKLLLIHQHIKIINIINYQLQWIH